MGARFLLEDVLVAELPAMLPEIGVPFLPGSQQMDRPPAFVVVQTPEEELSGPGGSIVAVRIARVCRNDDDGAWAAAQADFQRLAAFFRHPGCPLRRWNTARVSIRGLEVLSSEQVRYPVTRGEVLPLRCFVVWG